MVIEKHSKSIYSPQISINSRTRMRVCVCVRGIEGIKIPKIHLRVEVCLMCAPCGSEAVEPLNRKQVFELRPVMSKRHFD